METYEYVKSLRQQADEIEDLLKQREQIDVRLAHLAVPGAVSPPTIPPSLTLVPEPEKPAVTVAVATPSRKRGKHTRVYKIDYQMVIDTLAALTIKPGHWVSADKLWRSSRLVRTSSPVNASGMMACLHRLRNKGKVVLKVTGKGDRLWRATAPEAAPARTKVLPMPDGSDRRVHLDRLMIYQTLDTMSRIGAVVSRDLWDKISGTRGAPTNLEALKAWLHREHKFGRVARGPVKDDGSATWLPLTESGSKSA